MKKILFISSLLISLFVHAEAQVNCDDYKIVSIFDIPPSPQTPGGNYFLLLLTLNEDNVSNIDNYANLFFINNLGDTISIPTGQNSTLPRYSSDTIPYILQLNSTSSNQDFPDDFNGNLVIIHSTKLICEVNYSEMPTNTLNIHAEIDLNIYPNPFVDFIKIDSDKHIKSIFIVSDGGRIVDRSSENSFHYEMNLKNLSAGKYLIIIQFEGGESELYNIIKI